MAEKRKLKRTTITVDFDLYDFAMKEAADEKLNDFSTYVRTLIRERKQKKERVAGLDPQTSSPNVP